MEPVTLTTDRLLLRAIGAQDADAVYAAAQDPDIGRWLSQLPSPYLPEHARHFTEQMVPQGWADGSVFFWVTKEHRGNGYVTEAALAVARWAFTRLAVDRLEWRAEVGNNASRAVAERVGFTLEGTLRSALDSRGVRRDCWVGSLLPSDLGLPPTAPYLPAPA
ncbi:GNAT family N-acetyltransferase [Streptomyces triticisoli]|uniref:GNAT family N-acetyltransferase n=1 Tax=Streptomyces triticisoli TaxID=2182797 RepID=UPI000DDACE11|nr:GNAT family N-acetyltransferase [Streptomyces triticisoli]